jgi:hypothetical protein
MRSGLLFLYVLKKNVYLYSVTLSWFVYLPYAVFLLLFGSFLLLTFYTFFPGLLFMFTNVNQARFCYFNK